MSPLLSDMDKRFLLLFIGFLTAWAGFTGLFAVGFWLVSDGSKKDMLFSIGNITRVVAEVMFDEGTKEMTSLTEKFLDSEIFFENVTSS